ncbi:hypothetical protein [Paraburkholderia sp. Cpub6]|uniref:hypothetical protein n=1 Tax=Paraburkholderia sp. Cpub6 TaxID=2723094 RepID=UPI00161D89DF|nr:hypothetical protein [Paraburkholderia sp. Cpub6]MBB5463792.1 hypothetical protein [Paraburkholderia sp. Cpub6]
MAEVKLNVPRTGRKDLIEAVRSAAYCAGYVAGENVAEARADLFRREMAVVLVALGDAIAAGERANMFSWYGVASRVFAGGAVE